MNLHFLRFYKKTVKFSYTIDRQCSRCETITATKTTTFTSSSSSSSSSTFSCIMVGHTRNDILISLTQTLTLIQGSASPGSCFSFLGHHSRRFCLLLSVNTIIVAVIAFEENAPIVSASAKLNRTLFRSLELSFK